MPRLGIGKVRLEPYFCLGGPCLGEIEINLLLLTPIELPMSPPPLSLLDLPTFLAPYPFPRATAANEANEAGNGAEIQFC